MPIFPNPPQIRQGSYIRQSLSSPSPPDDIFVRFDPISWATSRKREARQYRLMAATKFERRCPNGDSKTDLELPTTR